MRIYRKISSLMIAFGLLLWILAGTFIPVYAEDSADGSLKLICKFDDVALSGMQWNIFYAGKRNGHSFATDGDFSDYKISFKDISADALSDIASTLETYAIIDKIKPLQSEITDDNGIIDFTGLEQGLYLVCGKRLKVGVTTYIPIPFIVEIGEENGSNQNYTVYPKFFKFGVLDEKDADYTVRKIWRNAEDEPFDTSVKITVEMYKDGEYDSTITLSEENDWSYTWTATAHTDWRVKEINIPEDYTVIYRSNETQYVIVNTHKKYDVSAEPPETTEPVTETTSTMTETTVLSSGVLSSGTYTTTSVKPENSDSPKTSITTAPAEKLPQTGQLWWPVPLLAGGGIVFIAMGLRIRSRKENQHEE